MIINRTSKAISVTCLLGATQRPTSGATARRAAPTHSIPLSFRNNSTRGCATDPQNYTQKGRVCLADSRADSLSFEDTAGLSFSTQLLGTGSAFS